MRALSQNLFVNAFATLVIIILLFSVHYGVSFIGFRFFNLRLVNEIVLCFTIPIVLFFSFYLGIVILGKRYLSTNDQWLHSFYIGLLITVFAGVLAMIFDGISIDEIPEQIVSIFAMFVACVVMYTAIAAIFSFSIRAIFKEKLLDMSNG